MIIFYLSLPFTIHNVNTNKLNKPITAHHSSVPTLTTPLYNLFVVFKKLLLYCFTRLKHALIIKINDVQVLIYMCDNCTVCFIKDSYFKVSALFDSHSTTSSECQLLSSTSLINLLSAGNKSLFLFNLSLCP